MSTNPSLAARFISENLDQEKVKIFADHISRFEVESGHAVKRALINGIAPFEEIPTVEFEIPKQDLAISLERLLNDPTVNPNIIVNGIPALGHYNVKVFGGR
jgi:hypothetical protein